MNFFTILIFCIALTTRSQGQTFVEKIALDACEQLDSIDNFQVLQDSIQPSISLAFARMMISGTPEEKEPIGTVEGIRGIFKEVYEILPIYCYNIRRLIIEEKISTFYKMSDIALANDHFEKGNTFMEQRNYKMAIKEFKKALKKDKSFVYAIDHLAISYRRLENYTSAIKYYKKSLKIFPEGEIALLNIAVCYSRQEDAINSIINYEEFKYLYPKNPEGYFGLASMLFIGEDYENALDNLFIAHRIYVDTNSDYTKDSEQMISAMKLQMKELNKTELFYKKAKEYNITIGN